MEVKILGNSNLFFEGEGKFRYYGDVYRKRIIRFAPKLIFKKNETEKLEIILELPVSLIYNSKATDLLHFNILTGSIVRADDYSIRAFKISDIELTIKKWQIQVNGLLEHLEDLEGYPVEFVLSTTFLLKPEIKTDREPIEDIEDILKSFDN